MKIRGVLRLSAIATIAFIWLFIATWKTTSIRGNHWAWYSDYADELAVAYWISIFILFLSSGILISRKEEKHLAYLGLITSIVSILLLPSIGTFKE
jgi:hypothetical protein